MNCKKILIGALLSFFFLPQFIKADASLLYGDDSFDVTVSKNANDIEKVYVPSGKKINFIIETNDNFIGNVKPISIRPIISSSSNISCTTSLLNSNLYSLSNNEFRLINTNVELTSSNNKIGKISCTVPTTNEVIPISNNNWLTIKLESDNKDFNSGTDTIKTDKKN